MKIFSNFRYVLFGLGWLLVFFASYLYSVKNLIEVSIIILSLLLFGLNRKWADYISFSIFTFWLIVIITFEINSCLYFYELGCRTYLYLSLTTPRISTIWLLLFASIWIYLILSFIKRIKK